MIFLRNASWIENLYHDMFKKELQEHDNSNERNFLMCKSCFWCASFLNSRYRSLNACPACMNSELESMPISLNEIYTIDPWSKSRSIIRILE